MYIHEAVKKAMEIDGYITYNQDGKMLVAIKPTNTEANCILCVGKRCSEHGWQPSASHLLSDKWDVISEEEFKKLSNSDESYLKPERIVPEKEIDAIIYKAAVKLRELEKQPPERYLEFAPAVFEMLTKYLDSPFCGI